MQIIDIDQAKVEVFGGLMLEVLNNGTIGLMLSIGHRTGLFETMSALPPATSAQIAAAAGLNERYVREWLGAMVTGRIVDYDPASRTYVLPAEHAAVLTDRMGQNMGVTMQFLSVLGSVEGRIVEAFRDGGGVPYAAFDRFHEIMAQDSNQSVVAALTDSILPLSLA